jgi:hypothetical protein
MHQEHLAAKFALVVALPELVPKSVALEGSMVGPTMNSTKRALATWLTGQFATWLQKRVYVTDQGIITSDELLAVFEEVSYQPEVGHAVVINPLCTAKGSLSCHKLHVVV